MTVHFKGQSQTHTDELINAFLAKLNIPDNGIIDRHIKHNSVPSYQSQHPVFLNQLNQLLANDESLFLTGNYFTRLAVEDCVKRSYEEAQRLFKSHG